MILGTAIGPSEFRHGYDVINVGEVSAGGNTIIRAGHAEERGWQQSLHIVLTPTEREQLIKTLVGQRSDENVLRRERSDAIKAWGIALPVGAEGVEVEEAIRKWVLYGDTLELRDPWWTRALEWQDERRRQHNG